MTQDESARLRARIAYLEARILALQEMLESEACERLDLEAQLNDLHVQGRGTINKA